MSMVELDGIALVRGDNRILHDVCWRIEKGQHWALLGANASGKTALLKVVTGYEWPTEGCVTVLRQTFGSCHLPQLRRMIGWVSMAIEKNLPIQDKAIEIVASGFHASLGLYQELEPQQWELAHESLRGLGAESIADRPFGLLSQGEQQRVLIARAVVNRPSLLILDEPCAGLDPAARQRLLADLDCWVQNDEAPTIVLVTHHIEEIRPWIGRVLLLRGGRILASGPTDEVLTSATLSQAFGCPCQVNRQADHYTLKISCPLDRNDRGQYI